MDSVQSIIIKHDGIELYLTTNDSTRIILFSVRSTLGSLTLDYNSTAVLDDDDIDALCDYLDCAINQSMFQGNILRFKDAGWDFKVLRKIHNLSKSHIRMTISLFNDTHYVSDVKLIIMLKHKDISNMYDFFYSIRNYRLEKNIDKD